MGGNGAAIVLADADPEVVARKIGRYTNQHYGQTCCTVHRVFVDRKIADDFIEAQTEFFKGLKIGYQADAGTQLGAVINPTQRRRILRAQQETVARGGKAILVGRFVGIVRAVSPFIAGASGLRLRAFLPYSLLGTAAWASAFTLAGYLFHRSFEEAAGLLSRGALVLAVLAAIGLLTAHRLGRRRTRASRPAQ